MFLTEEIPSDDLEKVEILIAEPRSLIAKKLIHKCPNLKWLHSPWAGVEILLKCEWGASKVISFLYYQT